MVQRESIESTRKSKRGPERVRRGSGESQESLKESPKGSRENQERIQRESREGLGKLRRV